MRIVVGGAGTIGRRLVPVLRSHGHDVVVAGRTSGNVHVDLTAHATIEAMYHEVGTVDSVVSIAAHGALDEFTTLTPDALLENMRAKFFGAVVFVAVVAGIGLVVLYAVIRLAVRHGIEDVRRRSTEGQQRRPSSRNAGWLRVAVGCQGVCRCV